MMKKAFLYIILIFCSLSLYPQTSEYATKGITVAGGNGRGSAANQLYYPEGIFVDTLGNIYIADTDNDRIQKWSSNGMLRITLAGGNGRGEAANQLDLPTGIFVDKFGNIYIADTGNHRIQKWAPNATSGITVAGVNYYGDAANELASPSGLFVDRKGYIYIADSYNNRIQKWAPNATYGLTVAGGNGKGGAANQLNYPTNIFVDAKDNIYIADTWNNRIQKWAPNATSGITVAGGNGRGNAANQLKHPEGIFVDTLGNIYIVDTNNNRIQKWIPNATSGITIAGGNGYGKKDNKLSKPKGIFVDSLRNIYIADTWNNRIQKWNYLKSDSNLSRVNTNKNNQSNPPVLSISAINFSKDVLQAEQTGQLSISIKNSGLGDAKNVYVKLSSNIKELEFKPITNFPTIKANGGIEKVTISIKGKINLPTSEALVRVDIVEPIFKLKFDELQLKFATKEFISPKLILAKYAVLENLSSNPNKQIDINDIIDLKFVVQNVGQGNADNVRVDVTNNQNGIMFLGVVENDKLKGGKHQINYRTIQSGKFKTITYRYLINSDFKYSELKFIIKAFERVNKYGFIEEKSFKVNNPLVEIGYIRTVKSNDNIVNKNVTVEKVPDLLVDVDTQIPTTKIKQNSTYALIIGNEDYSSKQPNLTIEQNADFAVNDAQVFALYCKKTLGIPSNQIKILKNATSAQIKQALAWINNLSKIEKGNAKLVFYYSGHGLPDEQTKESYIIPVDVSGSHLEYAVKLADVYKNLTENKAKQVTVFLDACFSGGARNKSLLATKGIKVKPRKDIINGNMVVFASSSGDESSAIYKEKQHGVFTYFLLKKLKESNGKVNLNSLSSYIIKSVSKETGLKGFIQTPQVNASLKVINDWKLWKLN